jgi:hypothetical protein
MSNNLFKKKVTKSLESTNIQVEPSFELESSQKPTQPAQQEDPAIELKEEAVAYCKNSDGMWQLVHLKYDPVSGKARVESLGEANKDKEVVRERFIVECTERDML